MAWPFAAHAQQAGKLPTIGYLGITSSVESQRIAGFVQQLGKLGWNEGRDIAIEYRWAEGRGDLAAKSADEFVRLKVDVIVAVGTPAALAAKQATSASRLSSHQWGIRSSPVSLRVWRDRPVMSRDCQSSSPM